MEPTPELNRALDSLYSLTDALADERAEMAVVRADGRWHLQEAGTIYSQTPRLSADVCSALIKAAHRHGPTACLDDDWWIRPHHEGTHRSVILRRRPTAHPPGLSDHTLELLQKRLRPETNGLIFGPDPSARSGVLTSLVRWLPADFIVHVGPVPPSVSDDLSIFHVPPPADDRDRRRLAGVCEGASAVLLDGPTTTADLRAVTAGADPVGRWIGVDTTRPNQWGPGVRPEPAVTSGLDARLGVRGLARDEIRLEHFSMRRGDGWEVLLGDADAGESTEEVTTVAEETSDEYVRPTQSYDHGASRPDEESTTNPETPSRIRERPDSLRESSSPQPTGEHSENLRESGEIQISDSSAEADAETPSLTEQSSPDEEIRGERIDGDLPRLVANRDVDDVDIPELDPRQLRRTFEGDVDIQALRAERRKQRREARGEDVEQLDEDREESKTNVLGAHQSEAVQEAAREGQLGELAGDDSQLDELGEQDSGIDELADDSEVETDVLGDEESSSARQADSDAEGLDEESDIPETTEFTPPEGDSGSGQQAGREDSEVQAGEGDDDDQTERLEVKTILENIDEDAGDESP